MSDKYRMRETQEDNISGWRWGLEKGYTVLPRSSSPSHLRENFDLHDWRLEEEDLHLLDSLGLEETKYAWNPASVLWKFNCASSLTYWTGDQGRSNICWGFVFLYFGSQGMRECWPPWLEFVLWYPVAERFIYNCLILLYSNVERLFYPLAPPDI